MVYRELPMPRGRHQRSKMVQVSDSLHVMVPGSSDFEPPPPPYPDPAATWHLDAMGDRMSKDVNNQITSNVVAVDGNTYALNGGIWHEQNLSPSGRPVYTFTAGGFLALSFPNQTEPYTVIAVAKAAVTNARLVVVGGNSSFVDLGLDGTSAWYAYTGGSAGTPPFALANIAGYDTNMHVLEAVYNGANSVLAVDGAETAGDAGSRWLGGLKIGSDRVASYLFNGDIGEVAIFPGVLSAQDRLTWRNYLTAKWITPP